jgi:hypothetical protein
MSTEAEPTEHQADVPVEFVPGGRAVGLIDLKVAADLARVCPENAPKFSA